MSRKVYLEGKVKITLSVDDDVDFDAFVSELDIEVSPGDTDIGDKGDVLDATMGDFTVVDSK